LQLSLNSFFFILRANDGRVTCQMSENGEKGERDTPGEIKQNKQKTRKTEKKKNSSASAANRRLSPPIPYNNLRFRASRLVVIPDLRGAVRGATKQKSKKAKKQKSKKAKKREQKRRKEKK
jgi:hypothetical protein